MINAVEECMHHHEAVTVYEAHHLIIFQSKRESMAIMHFNVY